jgi:hypothetical protein
VDSRRFWDAFGNATVFAAENSMIETSPYTPKRRGHIAILWLSVVIACVGLGVVSLQHWSTRQRAPQLVPAADSSRQEAVDTFATTSPVAPPQRAKEKPLARVPHEKPQVPAARHFMERISSEGAGVDDSTPSWTAGRPIMPSRFSEADTFDGIVDYWLPDGNVVEYDLRSNQYRVLVGDSLGMPERMEQLDQLDHIGGYRPSHIR